MKAWTVTAAAEPSEALELTEKTLPEPDTGQLVIEVKACGLALPDVAMCRGTYRLMPPRPFTPGLDFAGAVIGTGPGTSIPIGTRVMGISAFYLGHGSLAQQCLAREGATYAIPDDMDDATAAAFTIAFQTAYVGLITRGGMREGDWVLVHGATGGTGAAALQLAKAKGARVIATAGNAERVAACLAAGADIAINYNEGDFVADVIAATEGNGVDLVYDPVGGEVFERSVECTAREGRLLPIGSASGRWGVPACDELTLRNISVVGVLPSGYPRETMLALHEDLLELHRAGKISASIDHIADFAQAPQYLQAMADREVKGRVVITCS